MATITTQTTNTDNAGHSPTIGIGAINLLKSPLATLVVLCSALLAQLPHAADVFRMIVMGSDWLAKLHSYTYAVALELAVLLFVVQRRNVESYFFAFVSILVNLSYYYLHGVALISIAALPAWLISIALPLAIAQYSHLIAASVDGVEAETAKLAKPAKVRRYRWQFWRKPLESPAELPAPNDTTLAPIVAPSPSGGHSEAAGKSRKPRGTAKTGKSAVSPETKAIILRSIENGAKPVDVAGEFSVSINTVRSWLSRTAKQTNGVH